MLAKETSVLLPVSGVVKEVEVKWKTKSSLLESTKQRRRKKKVVHAGATGAASTQRPAALRNSDGWLCFKYEPGGDLKGTTTYI
jgi:hypothetical protein